MRVDDEQAIAVLGEKPGPPQQRERTCLGERLRTGEGCLLARRRGCGEVEGGELREPQRRGLVLEARRLSLGRGGGSGAARWHRRRGGDERPRLGERLFERALHEVVNEARLAEPNLALGRMHVDVHLHRIEAQFEHMDRLSLVVQHVAVGGAHGMGEPAILDRPPVDQEKLEIGTTAARRRRRDPALKHSAERHTGDR